MEVLAKMDTTMDITEELNYSIKAEMLERKRYIIFEENKIV